MAVAIITGTDLAHQKMDLHTHTIYSDGHNTPEEMIHAAIALGLDTIGLSDHSYMSFDESWCIPKSMVEAYQAEIRSLAEQYKGQIRVLTGVEQDIYSYSPASGYDYVIGSVHYIKKGGAYLPIDLSAEAQAEAVSTFYDGDWYGYAEDYFSLVGQVVEKTGADIIGHFDLIAKFNEGGKLFDPSHPRYIAAWQAAADRLLSLNVPFEINTGAISRGYRATPYPDMPVFQYLKARGASFLLSSDSHATDTIAWQFEKWAKVFGTDDPRGTSVL